jgi:hypothetical protein
MAPGGRFAPAGAGQAAGMEDRPEESDIGYPEEQPSEVSDRPQKPAEDKPQREGGQSGAQPPPDDGTATGNRRNAGADG